MSPEVCRGGDPGGTPGLWRDVGDRASDRLAASTQRTRRFVERSQLTGNARHGLDEGLPQIIDVKRGRELAAEPLDVAGADVDVSTDGRIAEIRRELRALGVGDLGPEHGHAIIAVIRERRWSGRQWVAW